MKLSPRLRRRAIFLVAAVALLAAVVVFVLPPIVKAQAEKKLSAALGRTVTIGRVRLNPATLALTVENFDVREKDPGASFLGWSRLYVNFDALASLSGDWVLGGIELDGFHAAVAINRDGAFNFSDLLAKLAPPPAPKVSSSPEKPARAVRVVSLKVGQARVDFSDQSRARPFATVVGPLTFALTEFRTAGERGAPYHFAATTEAGEKLTWAGTLAADPVESRGEFAVENLILKKYTPYFEDKVHADLVDGLLTIRGRYEVNLDDKKRALRFADGELHLRDLRLNERGGGSSIVELPALDITGVQADAIALKAAVGRVALTGGRLAVRREKDGTINLLTLLAASAAPPTPPVVPTTLPRSPAPQPDFMVGEISLQDFKLELNDLAAPRPAQLALSGVNVSVKNVTLADGAVLPFALAFDWAPRGKVQVTGNVSLKPALSAALEVEVAGLEILPLSPYLEQFVNARLTQGVVSALQTVRLETAGGSPAVTLAGEVALENFGLVDGAHSEELAGFSRLALSGLKVSTAPLLTVSLAELNLVGPYARVIVNADKSVNLAALAKSRVPASAPSLVSAAPKPPVASALPAPPPPKIEIGRVVLSDGDFSFADRSIEPNLRITLNEFGGTVGGLSSQNLARADVDLKGSVDGAGPVAITGKLDPLGANTFVDLKVDFKNVDLVPLSPYAGKFAGYELARGKLVVDTKFLLEGKKIEATNVVTLNQFTFGAATNSPDATKLPVRLGVALLKDTDGKIVIDLPVQGSLDDPNFRIGRVVLRVVVNLLTKAAVSPFGLIGSMFGGGGDELAFQEFLPGESELLPAEAPKLDTLIKALNARPALSLGIEGGSDAEADAHALKKSKLADRVRRASWEERHASDPGIAPPERLEIAPEAHVAMVKKLFDAAFPPGTQFGAPLPPPPVVAAPPPKPPAGFFQRIVNSVTGKERREQAVLKKENDRRAVEHEQAVASAVAAGLPLEEMTGRLAETMEITDNDLRALAAARAQRVRDHLAGVGQIAADRLFLAQPGETKKENKGPRVFLSLQ